MAGLPALRRACAGDFADETGDEGAEPDVAGLRGVVAAGGDVADQWSLLHTVELVAANRDAVHRRRPGLRRRAQVAADESWSPRRGVHLPAPSWCRSGCPLLVCRASDKR